MNALTDTYQRNHSYLRIAVTERCNLRCRYCMPEEGIDLQPRESLLRLEEIIRAAEIFADMGVTKIRLTGGEPLVRKGLQELIRQLKEIPGIKTVGLTTNGVLVGRFAHELKSAGLDALNISLDTLRPERFERIARRDHYDDVMHGIESALANGLVPLKINTVVIRGINDDELCDFVEFAKATGVNVRFIEYMPFDSNKWNENGFIGYTEMLERIVANFTLVLLPNSDSSAVAKNYRIAGSKGSVGFITSMSEHFCGSCNRVRLTADGHVKACLFSSEEYSIRESLRANDRVQTEGIIRSALAEKQYTHAPMNELVELENRAMIRIGG